MEMPWKASSAWPFPCSIEAAAAARAGRARGRARAALVLFGLIGLGLGAGCSDQACGPDDAPAAGVIASVKGESITYGEFVSSPNNDCSVPGAPISLTVEGIQVDPVPQAVRRMTFCLPRPDLLGRGPVALDDLELVHGDRYFFGELADGCSIQLDRTVPAAGTIEFQGYCDEGVHPAGYALVIEGAVAGTDMCTGEPLTVELSGRAAVQAPSF
jgi:hypothetical protein